MARRRKRPKRPDRQQAHELHRQRLEDLSPTIRERFPAVKAIRIDVTFEDPDHFEAVPARPWALRFTPDHKAFFDEKCPFRECVEGGFDFSSAIREAIDTAQATATGILRCQGWQDRERIGAHRCLLAAHYTIQIE
jgi:hypothetical protein